MDTNAFPLNSLEKRLQTDSKQLTWAFKQFSVRLALVSVFPWRITNVFSE